MSSQDKDPDGCQPVHDHLAGLQPQINSGYSVTNSRSTSLRKAGSITDLTFPVLKPTASSKQIIRSETATQLGDPLSAANIPPSSSQSQNGKTLKQLALDPAMEVIANGSHLPEMDVNVPRKKARKRRAKKKSAIDHQGETVTGLLPIHWFPPFDESSSEHICDSGDEQDAESTSHAASSHDCPFHTALSGTINELLDSTPFDAKLRLEIHVVMNKVKRRVDEVAAAGGDARPAASSRTPKSKPKCTRKQPSANLFEGNFPSTEVSSLTASSKGPFSAFGKLETPGLQRAASVHLLSSPKYYASLQHCVSHLDYLIACGDQKAPVIADEVALLCDVVIEVYKEIYDKVRAKIKVDANKDDSAFIVNKAHKQRLAESANKMRELEDKEKSIRHVNTRNSVIHDIFDILWDASSDDAIKNGAIRHFSPDTPGTPKDIETTALALRRHPPLMTRFIARNNELQMYPELRESSLGLELCCIHQKLVDMGAVPVEPRPQPCSNIELVVRPSISGVHQATFRGNAVITPMGTSPSNASPTTLRDTIKSNKADIDGRKPPPIGVFRAKSPSTREDANISAEHEAPEMISETVDQLTPSQMLMKKRFMAANFNQIQKSPLDICDIRARARDILSDYNSFSSFLKSKKVMEYQTGFEDSLEERFFLNEINKIYAEMKKIKANVDAGVESLDAESPSTSSMLPTTTESATPNTIGTKDDNTILARLAKFGAAMVLPPSFLQTSPIIGHLQSVEVRMISGTASEKQKFLARLYAQSHDHYVAFLLLKEEVEEAVLHRPQVATKDDEFQAQEMVRVMRKVDNMVSELKTAEAKRSLDEDKERAHMAAADAIADLEGRLKLAIVLEILSTIFDEETSSELSLDVDASAESVLADSQRLEDQAASLYRRLFTPVVFEDGKKGGHKQQPDEEGSAEETGVQYLNTLRFPGSLVDDVARPFVGEEMRIREGQIATTTLTDPLDVVKLALGNQLAGPGLVSSTEKLPSRRKCDLTRPSDADIQRVLAGLDSMPIPPSIVADLCASRRSKDKVRKDSVPRFTNADEAVSYLQNQMEGSKVPVSATIAHTATIDHNAVHPSYFIDKHGNTVSDKYTLVADSTCEGQALGKAMVDIQLTASQGIVPSDLQMGALGKARRELYASRLEKFPQIQSTNIQFSNFVDSKDDEEPLYRISPLAKIRATCSHMARSELAHPRMATNSLRTLSTAPRSLKSQQWSSSPLSDFPLPQPAPEPHHPTPEPVKESATINKTGLDALRTSPGAAVVVQPAIAPINTVREVQESVDELFSYINKCDVFHRFCSSLGVSDAKDAQTLFAVNKAFATYKVTRIFEEDRIIGIHERIREHQTRLAWASEEARIANLALEILMSRHEHHVLYRKFRGFVAEGELHALDGISEALAGSKDETSHKSESSRIAEKMAREFKRRLRDGFESYIGDIQAVVEGNDSLVFSANRPKLGSFRC